VKFGAVLESEFLFLALTTMFSINKKNTKTKILLWPFDKPSSFFPSQLLLNLTFASILNIWFFVVATIKKVLVGSPLAF